MLRIECTCGKILKLNESLLGKKIKCPACAAIQLVNNSTTAAAPTPDSEPAWNDAPQPQKTHTKQQTLGEREPKPAKKGGNKALWLLVGGSALLVIVAGISLAVWYVFLQSDDNSAARPSPKPRPNKDGQLDSLAKSESKKGSQDSVAIKLFVPHKVGDRREIKMVAVNKLDKKLEEEAKVSAEVKAALATHNRQQKTTLRGTLTTLEVNDQGEETKILLDLKEVNVENLNGKGEAPTMAKSGKVLGMRQGSSFVWSHADGGPSLFPSLAGELGDFVSDRYLSLPESQVDAIFGTTQRRNIKELWKLDTEAVARAFSQHLFLSTVIMNDARGSTAKITEKDKAFIDFDVRLDGHTGPAGGPGQDKSGYSFKARCLVRLPEDGSTGFVKKKEIWEDIGEDQLPIPGEQAKIVVIVTKTKSLTTEIAYLGQSPDGVLPVAKGNKPAQGEAVAIKLWVPFKQGDTREVKISGEVKQERKFENVESLPPDSLEDAKDYEQIETLAAHGLIKTLEVNEKGQETKVELTVHFLKMTRMYKKPPVTETTVPKGVVAIGTRNEGRFKWTGPMGEELKFVTRSLDMFFDGLHGQEWAEVARHFGTADPQTLGGAWPIKTDEIRKQFENPTAKNKSKIDITGGGKWLGMSSENGKTFLDVRFGAEVSVMESEWALAHYKYAFDVRLPRDASTGPVKIVETLQSKDQHRFNFDEGPFVGKPPLAKSTLTKTSTTEIHYLGTAPVKDHPVHFRDADSLVLSPHPGPHLAPAIDTSHRFPQETSHAPY